MAKPSPKPKPLTVALSSHQRQRVQAMQQEFNAVRQIQDQRLSDTVTAILAAEIDPASVQGWDIRLGPDGATIVCTPPAEEQKPRLVKDIGPDGVSEAAATS